MTQRGDHTNTTNQEAVDLLLTMLDTMVRFTTLLRSALGRKAPQVVKQHTFLAQVTVRRLPRMPLLSTQVPLREAPGALLHPICTSRLATDPEGQLTRTPPWRRYLRQCARPAGNMEAFTPALPVRTVQPIRTTKRVATFGTVRASARSTAATGRRTTKDRVDHRATTTTT